MPSNRWFVREFDPKFVHCYSCERLYLRADMMRKNKCPNCKLDNYHRLPTKPDPTEAK